MSELLAILFIFFTVVLYQLTKKGKFDLPPYAVIKQINIESQVQQEALEKMWVSHILHIQQGIIALLSVLHLIEWGLKL